MLLLKACPHCHGDLVFERDGRTSYLECIQCGHLLSRGEERELGVRSARRGLVHVLASTRRPLEMRHAPVAMA
jgi:hypothetical protein